MKRILILPILLLAVNLLSCTGGKKAQSRLPEVDTRAPWIIERPRSDADYIGIAYGSKSLPDYQESAKKSALNDLASEISVTIEGNSLLYSIERNYKLKEEYISSIKTTTKEQLEGYERVDTWEDAERYWVYYRLSKAKYSALKKQKKQAALDRSLDLHSKAAEAYDRGNLAGSLDLEIKALLALKDHWGEQNRVALDGREVLLDNEEYALIRKHLDEIGLEAVPSSLSLNYGNGYRQGLSIRVYAAMERSRRPLSRIPIEAEYEGMESLRSEQRLTGEDGSAEIIVANARYKEGSNDLVVRVRMEELLPASARDPWMKALTSDVPVPEIRVPLKIELPNLYLSSDERNLGQPLASGGIAAGLQSLLSRRGFRFVSDAASADYILRVKADTREGGTANGFYLSWLDLEIIVEDARLGKQRYQDSRQSIKGIQLDHQKAGRDAYKRAANLLEKEIMPELMKALF